MRRNVLPPLLCGSLLLTLGGCGSQPLFQFETVVRGDGSCTRTIWQPTDEMLPEEANRQEWVARWARTGRVAVPPAFAAERPRDSDRQYFVASGRFGSPAEIPEHFRHVAEIGPERAVGRLDRRYERRDYAFVVDHRWRETLTNTVTREGFLAARDRFLDLGQPLLEEAITRVYGSKYDVRGLLRDLRTSGRPFLERAALIWFEEASLHREDAFSDRLADLAGELGLDLKHAGKRLEGTDLDERLKAFLKHRILLGFRHRDGARLTEAEVRAILEPGPDSPYTSGWEQFAKEHEPEIRAKLSAPLLGMIGLYNGLFDLGGSGNPKLAVTLRLPGAIVETSGSRPVNGTTSWRFSGDASYPGGYVMSARSLEIDREAQQRILGQVAIADIDQATRLVQLAERAPGVRARLAKVRETGERKWLEAEEGPGRPGSGEYGTLRRLLKLSR